MPGVVIQYRDRARKGVSGPMVVWAVVMAVVFFALEARWGPRRDVTECALVSTAALGAYLGWRRRVGTIFVAPMVSWLVAWPLVIVASMIHDGIVGGFFVGLFLVTIGWLGVSFLEIIALGVVALVVSRLRGPGRGGPDVVVFGPGSH